MLDTDGRFDAASEAFPDDSLGDASEDADGAAALYELAAPDLPPPTSVRREATHDPEIAAWAVHAKGGVVRMKIAGVGSSKADAAAARLRRGALLLRSLAARGVRAPEPLRFVEKPRGASVAVALERRLGTTDAAVGWPVLGSPLRLAFAEALARALLELHRIQSTTGPESDAGPAAPLAWRTLLLERVRRRVSFLGEADVLSRESAGRIEVRLVTAAARLPELLEPSLCHGGFTLAAAVLERRAFAGLKDFESACLGDRWLDVAAALAALGGPESGPGRRFLDVYTASAIPPADLVSRFDLYGGLVLLRALSVVAVAFPSEARSAADRLSDEWIGAESPTGPTSDSPPPPS